ncbi:hypothetical protein SERLA73DRAFT_191359 [Serpula lacrymans var. lacrymans S7.3]|uniref:Holocytochrome c-type synthase n=2 Tax=Serpula lacrymans var. lacrymans TaxID=341189 RepID=F8QHD6_SERL3|nr:uncharacterized protein SERLADRAFT_472834 [Serpula lacrymans var. lacrymans S7.9]EGN92246.1 hypothetical protein SERLA73DRAFT_191359 [Serpula lacrymans var. lacrymans S7.3]EGO22265.1 hypothetical protein SERLADRAFT_472834 [Serpula lacrymans var. lacrymans S7.9]
MGQTTSSPKSLESPSSCPIQHQTLAASGCPIQHDSSSKPQCPIDHTATGLNPLNQMPTLSQSPAPHQSLELPTQRTESSIPRDPAAKWEYPSPQQFYNALVRKGWETPEEHVETMVDIHNFLNEQAWQEVLKWEKRTGAEEEPHLARFKGRPGEISPKARFWLFAGWLLPSRFNAEPPFDRHDWVVRRPKTGEEVRYVIDYYSAPTQSDGAPVFSLDVRPALDSFGSVKERISVATEEAWSTFRETNNSRPIGRDS